MAYVCACPCPCLGTGSCELHLRRVIVISESSASINTLIAKWPLSYPYTNSFNSVGASDNKKKRARRRAVERVESKSVVGPPLACSGYLFAHMHAHTYMLYMLMYNTRRRSSVLPLGGISNAEGARARGYIVALDGTRARSIDIDEISWARRLLFISWAKKLQYSTISIRSTVIEISLRTDLGSRGAPASVPTEESCNAENGVIGSWLHETRLAIRRTRSPRRGLTRLAIDGAQHSHDEVRSENHTHKRAPDAGAKAQQERMMAPEARTTLTR
ncbi:unnamed protein product [Trichogramma brassicae]|uniref:Uncharacterized protein n=1 Tax=Trichogramma brassicae TaxID=86971 RepID=A0A6H5J8A2_9HYME|nr:unnamed protein product [Trichogramma brassicae]